MTFGSDAQRKAVFAAMRAAASGAYRNRKVGAFIGATALVGHKKTRESYPNLSLAAGGLLSGMALHTISRPGGPLHMLHAKNTASMGRYVRRAIRLQHAVPVTPETSKIIEQFVRPAARSFASTHNVLNLARAGAVAVPLLAAGYAGARALNQHRKRRALNYSSGLRTEHVTVTHKRRLISTPTPGASGRLEYKGVAA